MAELTGGAAQAAEALKALGRDDQVAVIEAVMGDHSVCRTMLSATGRLEERPRVSYVVGTPPQAPLLKAVRQPLVDTEPYRSGTTRLGFFVDNRKFYDGMQKGPGDTNMGQSGQLGYPLEYDMRWIELHLTGKPEDCKALRAAANLTLFFGCNTPILRLPAATMKPIIELPDLKLKRRLAKKIADAFRARGQEFGHYWYPVDVQGKPRRLESTHSFRAELEVVVPVPLVGPEVRVQVCLQDVLYTMV